MLLYFLKKGFLIFRKLNFLARRLKICHIFSGKSVSYNSGNRTFLKKLFILEERTLRARQIKKLTPKKSLIFREINFLATSLKRILILFLLFLITANEAVEQKINCKKSGQLSILCLLKEVSVVSI